MDVVPHLIQDAVIPARAGGFGALLADEPDGGREGRLMKRARVRLLISVWIGQLPSTTNPARMIAETSVSQASGCLWAKTMTSRPFGDQERGGMDRTVAKHSLFIDDFDRAGLQPVAGGGRPRILRRWGMVPFWPEWLMERFVDRRGRDQEVAPPKPDVEESP